MFRVITDITADLPREYLLEHDIGVMNLSFSIGDIQSTNPDALDIEEFYRLMREGKTTKTSQPSPADIKELMETSLEKYDGILVIALSSGISGTYSAACLARDLVLEEREDANIVIIDSLGASLGEGLLVDKIIGLRQSGKSLEECAAWAEEHKKNIIHCFTVDDLMFLSRGGRLEKGKAVVGTLINIKPLLKIDDDGRLENFDSARGRKKSINAMIDYMENNIGSYRDKGDYIFICHGDCLSDAEYMAEKVKVRLGLETRIINYVGTTIGSHTGPGTLGVFFMGDRR